jgi:glycine cleavage system H lipoate-binding protein
VARDGMAIAFRKVANGPERQPKRPAGGKHMTVILVLSTFIVFLLIDYFFSKKHIQIAVQPAVAQRERVARLEPSLVGGFQVPENLRFHPGHTWALNEGPSLVRVGMDDFASKLVGKVERMSLPQRGQWIRQGQKLISVFRDGAKVDMLSPIEGSIADINDAVIQNPELARRDPYGEGWLVTVQSPDAKTNFRNLMGGALARWWTEEAASRLQKRVPAALGALAQDGGVAMDNLTAQMPEQNWTELTREFFLS